MASSVGQLINTQTRALRVSACLSVRARFRIDLCNDLCCRCCLTPSLGPFTPPDFPEFIEAAVMSRRQAPFTGQELHDSFALFQSPSVRARRVAVKWRSLGEGGVGGVVVVGG